MKCNSIRVVDGVDLLLRNTRIGNAIDLVDIFIELWRYLGE